MFVHLKINKHNEYILKLNLPRIKKRLFVSHMVDASNTSLRFILRHYYTMIMGFGVGIGMSMSIVVAQSPLGVQAQPLVSGFSSGVALRTLTINNEGEIFESNIQKLNDLRELQWIISNDIAHYEQSASLHSFDPIILTVGLQHPLHTELKAFGLGDSLNLIGENNGEYTYGVVAIRDFSLAEVLQPSLFTEYDSSVIVLFKDSLRNQYFKALVLQRQDAQVVSASFK